MYSLGFKCFSFVHIYFALCSFLITSSFMKCENGKCVTKVTMMSLVYVRVHKSLVIVLNQAVPFCNSPCSPPIIYKMRPHCWNHVLGRTHREGGQMNITQYRYIKMSLHLFAGLIKTMRCLQPSERFWQGAA